MEQLRLRVTGMTCQGCVRSVKRVLEAVPGARSAAVSLESGEAVVEFDPGHARAADFVAAVDAAGYQARLG
jgi:copper chaperone